MVRLTCKACLIVFGFVATASTAYCDDNTASQRAAYPDQRFFLKQIFQKYGDNGIITFEGFEHLLESLGLGRLSFDKKHDVSAHRINGSFQDVHDALHLHEHRHGDKEMVDVENDNKSTASSNYEDEGNFEDVDKAFLHTDTAGQSNESGSRLVFKRSALKDSAEVPFAAESDYGLCLSPEMLLRTFGLRPNHSVAIKPSRFLHLCPAIVYQLDRRVCSVEVTPVGESTKVHVSPKRSSTTQALLNAMLATLVISSVGLIAVLMVRLTRREEFLHFLVALAAGTLGGDALVHLLPHALLSEDITHEDVTFRCGATLMAVIFFYGLEGVLLRVHSRPTNRKAREIAPATELETIGRNDPGSETARGEDAGPMLPPGHGHAHGMPGNASSSLKNLVVVGDVLHNFTDGLAIGASFGSDPVAGFATAIAVFCHELPHELGDFAVLINAGMSVKRALLYNVLSSGLSFVGAGIGVWLGEFKNATDWIYAATAGTFLYIALADLLPEMMSRVRRDTSIRELFVQLAGFASGGLLMIFIAIYEDKLAELLA